MQRISLYDCKFDLKQELDFGDEEFDIQFLSLNGSGIRNKNNWKKYPEKFERIIKAISNSNIRLSLQAINIS